MNRIFPLIMISICVLASCEKEKVDFDTLLREVDESLVEGALRQADEEIQQAAALASSRSEWLSLLKRAYRLGAAEGSYETLYAVSKTGIGKISGAEEIAALCVFASLRTGRTETAYRYAKEYLSSERWKPLRNEAVLRKSAVDQDVLVEAELENPLFAAVYTEDPATLARAAGLFNDTRFDLAAALRYAADGKIEEAARVVEPHVSEYPKVAFLLLYDAGRYGDAADTFKAAQIDGLDLVLADIYLKQGREEPALSLYRDFIRQNPKKSWIPYVNASLINSRQGNYEEALVLIGTGKESFPQTKQLLITEIVVRAQSDGSVDELIEQYKAQYPGDPEVAIVSAMFGPSEANRIRLENVLWGAVLENPEYSRPARYLAATLIASNDVEGLSRLIGVWERANGETGWSLFLRGYQAVLDDNTDLSIEAFSKSFELVPRWETAYNLSILAGKLGNHDQGIAYLRKAENTLAANVPEDLVTKSRLRAAMARMHYEAGAYEAAGREAAYAVDLAPGTGEAALILSLLEKERD